MCSPACKATDLFSAIGRFTMAEGNSYEAVLTMEDDQDTGM